VAGNANGPYNVRSVNTTQTLNGLAAVTPDSVVLCTCTAAGLTLTLPAVATNTGQVIKVKNISNTNTFVLAGVVAGDGGPNRTVAVSGNANNSPQAGSVLTVISNGTSWFVLDSN
jgi:hypothetical protein